MSTFTREDLLYGFHFSFSCVSSVNPVQKPLLASIHIDNEDDKCSKCYGKQHVFCVMQSDKNVFSVNAQLPWDMKFDSSSFISIRISNRYNDTILEAPIYAFWLQRQKERILKGQDVDILRCGVCNASQMEKISIGKGRHTCLLWMRRLGSRIGNAGSVIEGNMQQVDYKLMLLDKEFERFKNWMLQYTSSLEVGFIVGHRFLPMFAILCMADACDERSFNYQGWFQGKCHNKIWIQSWRKDWHDVMRFTQLFGYKNDNSFWKAVDLICCNLCIREKDMFQNNMFPFPQFNSMQKNQVDITCARMLVVDLLYRESQRDISSQVKYSCAGVEHLQDAWPCVCVGQTEENHMVLLHGLVNKRILNGLIMNNKLDYNTVLNLHQARNGNKKLKLVLLCWRDYSENVLCSVLLFNAFSHRLGVDCMQRENMDLVLDKTDAVAQVYVQKYSNVSMPFQHGFAINGYRALRPIIKVETLLNNKNATMSGKMLPWQTGYVVETNSYWEKTHVMSTFNVDRSISLKKQ